VSTLFITNYDSGSLRDAALGEDGNVYFFNGTFNPCLTVYRTNGILSSSAFAGWSTTGSTVGGKVTALGRYVFATDRLTGSDTQSDRGVVRFDLRGNTVQRFAARLGDVTDVAAGLDGLLHVLVTRSSAYGRQIVVFDPETMQPLRTVNLPVDYYAIAVDQTGDIFAAGHETNLDHYASNGVLVGSLPLSFGYSLSDLNLASNGLLVATVATGAVIVTTTALQSFTAFPLPRIGSQSDYCTYAAIVQPPPAAAVLTTASLPANLLVTTNANWKYLDNGSDPGIAWRSPDFDDSAWLSGPARLGFGEGNEATVVRYGTNIASQNITTYFRHAFPVANAWAVTNLQVALLRKDGGAVYLNGVEVLRSNLTNNPITSTSLAATNYLNTPLAFFTNALDPALLVNGTNVLAVEIHLFSTNRSSLCFALALMAQMTPAPRCELVRSGNNLMLTWPAGPAGLIPYTAADLSPQTSWTPLDNLPPATNGVHVITRQIDSPQRFFRLAPP